MRKRSLKQRRTYKRTEKDRQVVCKMCHVAMVERNRAGMDYKDMRWVVYYCPKCAGTKVVEE